MSTRPINSARPAAVTSAIETLRELDFDEAGDVHALAQELMERTHGRAGTDEPFFCAALRLAHARGDVEGLNKALGELLLGEEPGLSVENPEGDGYLRHLIAEELSGSEAERAVDILETGEDRFRGTVGDYLTEGIRKPFDALGDGFHDSPVKTTAILGGAIAAGAALTVAAPAVAAVAGLGFLGYEAISLVKNVAQAITADSDKDRAEHLIGVGEHLTGTALAAPALVGAPLVNRAVAASREANGFLDGAGRFVRFKGLAKPADPPPAADAAPASFAARTPEAPPPSTTDAPAMPTASPVAATRQNVDPPPAPAAQTHAPDPTEPVPVASSPASSTDPSPPWQRDGAAPSPSPAILRDSQSIDGPVWDAHVKALLAESNWDGHGAAPAELLARLNSEESYLAGSFRNPATSLDDATAATYAARYRFHGTSPENATRISAHGFDPNREGLKAGRPQALEGGHKVSFGVEHLARDYGGSGGSVLEAEIPVARMGIIAKEHADDWERFQYLLGEMARSYAQRNGLARGEDITLFNRLARNILSQKFDSLVIPGSQKAGGGHLALYNTDGLKLRILGGEEI